MVPHRGGRGTRPHGHQDAPYHDLRLRYRLGALCVRLEMVEEAAAQLEAVAREVLADQERELERLGTGLGGLDPQGRDDRVELGIAERRRDLGEGDAALRWFLRPKMAAALL